MLDGDEVEKERFSLPENEKELRMIALKKRFSNYRIREKKNIHKEHPKKHYSLKKGLIDATIVLTCGTIVHLYVSGKLNAFIELVSGLPRHL